MPQHISCWGYDIHCNIRSSDTAGSSRPSIVVVVFDMDFAWWYHNAVGISKYIPCINDIQQCDRHIHVQIRTGRPVGGCGLRRAVIRLIYEIFEIFKIYHRTSDIAHCTLGVENEYRENVVTVRLYYPRHTRLNKEIVRCTSYEYRYDRLWYATTKNKTEDCVAYRDIPYYWQRCL